jgi:hypothetical protein
MLLSILKPLWLHWVPTEFVDVSVALKGGRELCLGFEQYNVTVGHRERLARAARQLESFLEIRQECSRGEDERYARMAKLV